MIEPYYKSSQASLYHADCVELLKGVPENTVDAVVTDPPYRIGPWDSKWGNTGIAYQVSLWQEVLRVMKPGAHLVAFGGTRTHHRLWCALEDAGFEIRDALMWLYGSGFPKSLDVSKAIDKATGTERETVREYKGASNIGKRADGKEGYTPGSTHLPVDTTVQQTIPATVAARQWEGWGTALKPAWEPIVLARKPLSEPTVAVNVQRWGTGGLNIDGCRIGTDTVRINTWDDGAKPFGSGAGHPYTGRDSVGRWPPNVALDEKAAAMLDAQSGEREGCKPHWVEGTKDHEGWGSITRAGKVAGFSDSGGASRFFYCAKAGKKERRGSKHPTIKPLQLMRWLCRLVTPPRGGILDPFAGTGTTLEAAIVEGFGAVGIELDETYCADAHIRLTTELKPQ